MNVNEKDGSQTDLQISNQKMEDKDEEKSSQEGESKDNTECSSNSSSSPEIKITVDTVPFTDVNLSDDQCTSSRQSSLCESEYGELLKNNAKSDSSDSLAINSILSQE